MLKILKASTTRNRVIRGPWHVQFALAVLLVCGMGLHTPTTGAQAEAPQYGGLLDFIVGSKLPSYDAHRESTFGVIHPLAPFYSLLIRINPDNPQSPTDFVCDICEGTVPQPTDGAKTYTFRIRSDVRFHDATPLTSADVKASLEKIMFPPAGVASVRASFYTMVESITAPDATTLVIRLKFRSDAFIPALANPFNWIYSKQDLDEWGYNWHSRNVNGTGPFVFVEHRVGAFVQ